MTGNSGHYDASHSHFHDYFLRFFVCLARMSASHRRVHCLFAKRRGVPTTPRQPLGPPPTPRQTLGPPPTPRQPLGPPPTPRQPLGPPPTPRQPSVRHPLQDSRSVRPASAGAAADARGSALWSRSHLVPPGPVWSRPVLAASLSDVRAAKHRQINGTWTISNLDILISDLGRANLIPVTMGDYR